MRSVSTTIRCKARSFAHPAHRRQLALDVYGYEHTSIPLPIPFLADLSHKHEVEAVRQSPLRPFRADAARKSLYGKSMCVLLYLVVFHAGMENL